MVSDGYLPHLVVPPAGGNPNGFWYVHTVSGRFNSAIQETNTCFLLGSVCGFNPGYDLGSCNTAVINGSVPVSQIVSAQAALMFWPEGGISKDYAYSGDIWKGNAICYY